MFTISSTYGAADLGSRYRKIANKDDRLFTALAIHTGGVKEKRSEDRKNSGQIINSLICVLRALITSQHERYLRWHIESPSEEPTPENILVLLGVEKIK